MAVDPPRGPGLRPLPLARDTADAEDTEPFYETPSIPETTEERGDTTEILRPSSATTEILPRQPEELPPRIPQLPPTPSEPPRRPKPAPSRVVPLVGVLLTTVVGLALFALLVLLVALGA